MASLYKDLKVKDILLLLFAVAVYSLSGFFTKQASEYSFLSVHYIICLGGAIFVLGLYAILWQFALKRIPLNKAYPYRSLSIVYGMTIAWFFFQEEITSQNILGGVVVLLGLLILTINK